MNRLVRVELRRFYLRRLTRVGIVGIVLVVGSLLFSMFQEAKPPSAAQQRIVTAQFQEAHKEWEAHGDQMRADCLTAQADARTHDPKADLGCDHMEPTLASWGKPKPVFHELMPQALRGASYILAFLAFLVGAGFVGAEFTSGSLGTWLTFEPRRMRVYASKLAAAGLGMAPVAAVTIGVVTAGVWLMVRHFNPSSLTTAGMWSTLAGQAGRSLVLTLAAAVGGAVVALLLRHTAAALGVALGYLLVVDGLFAGAFDRAKPWLLRTNIDGWLQHGASYFVQECQTGSDGSYNCQGVQRTLSFGHSSAYLAVLLALAAGLAAAVFRRRDVG